MHRFESDFYGHELKVVVLGYIRPELDYISRGAAAHHPHLRLLTDGIDALIEDIETDKRVALRSLSRPAYQRYHQDPHFSNVQAYL